MSEFVLPAPTLDAATARVHSAEIAAHEFPRARKGLDPAAVKAWLTLVEASHRNLEEELAHERAERERLADSIRRMKRQPASAGVRAALMQTQLRRRAGGYDRKEVERLLHAAATELAQVETEAALLRAELEAAGSTPAGAELALRVARLERRIASFQDQEAAREIVLP